MTHLEKSVMDLQADPCSDFYRFACGNYRTLHPLKENEDYVFLSDLKRPDALAQMAAFLSDRNHVSRPDQRGEALHDYYRACVTAESQDAASLRILRPLLSRIDSYRNVVYLPYLLKDVFSSGAMPFFRIGAGFEPDVSPSQIVEIGPPSLSLARISAYSGDDEASVRSVAMLRDHISRVLIAVGVPERDAERDADAVLDVERRLAVYARNPVDNRDTHTHIHPYSLQRLSGAYSHFDWRTLFFSLNINPESAINVNNPQQLAAFDEALASIPPRAVRAYVKYSFLSSLPPVISPSALAQEEQNYSRSTGGRQAMPRTQECLLLTIGARRDDVIRTYVQNFLPGELKPGADEMVKQIKLQLAGDIASSGWLENRTRNHALQKLNQMSQVIVYGDLTEHYDRVKVHKHEAMHNYFLAQASSLRRDLSGTGLPVNRNRGKFHPLASGAVYREDVNTIEIPAAEWLPPSFDIRADPAENYARAGFTVGHELIHAFDDKGRHRDGAGKLVDWWTPEDASRFREKSACFVHEYETFGIDARHHENGQLTLGENIADNGGLHLAMLAYLAYARDSGVDLDHTVDGWTPLQRFFLSYAQDTCSAVQPASEELQMEINPHSLDRFRANGVLQNVPEFRKAFSCREGSRMAPRTPCSIW